MFVARAYEAWIRLHAARMEQHEIHLMIINSTRTTIYFELLYGLLYTKICLLLALLRI